MKQQDTQTATKWQLYTTADPTVTRIIPALAKEVGLNESIVLMQISYWIGISKNVRNGVYWTYHSLRDMQEEAFPYWSVETIRRTIKSLADNGYIVIGNFNRRQGDNTQWFALEPDKLSSLTSVLCHTVLPEPVSKRDTLSQNETPTQQNETTLPETPTENTQRKEKERKRLPSSPAPKPGTKDYLLAQFTPTHLSIADGILKQYTPDSYGMFSGAAEYLSTKTNPELERILDVVDSLSKKPTFVLDKLPKFYQYIKQDYQRRGLTVGISTFATQWDEWASKNRRPAQVIETVVAIPILEQALLDRAAREQQDNQS